MTQTPTAPTPILLCLDVEQSAMIQVNPDTGVATTLIANLGGVPDGIQVDTQAGLVYWTNMGQTCTLDDCRADDGTLEVARLDGSNRRVLLANAPLTTPKQLLLDPSTQMLYWCDREGGKVMRCRSDGSELTTLVARPRHAQQQADILDQCVGIAIDPAANRLYWTQKGPSKGDQGRIFSAGLSLPAGESAAQRSDIQTLLSDLPEPIDLLLDHPQHILYWTDRGAAPTGNSLNKAQVTDHGLSNHEVICTGFDEAIGLSLDRARNIMYVADLGGHIYQVDLGSGHYKVLYQQGQLTGITLYAPD